MFPLPRMLEYGNIAPDTTYILDIDFSTQQLGDTVPIDKSHNGFVFTKLQGTNGVVEYDPDINSNVYNISSGVCFITPKSTDLLLLGFDYEISFRYKNTTKTLGVLMEDGNYNGTTRTGGYTFMLNQVSTRYFQMFCDPYPGNYGRIEVPITNLNTWENIVFTVRAGQASVYVERTGQTYPFTLPSYVSGTGRYFSLFGDYVLPSNPEYFIGKISSIKIRKI